jgi:hypothetical protein
VVKAIILLLGLLSGMGTQYPVPGQGSPMGFRYGSGKLVHHRTCDNAGPWGNTAIVATLIEGFLGDRWGICLNFGVPKGAHALRL